MINNEIQRMGDVPFQNSPFFRNLIKRQNDAAALQARMSPPGAIPGSTGPMDPALWNKPMDPAAAARAAAIAQSVGKAAEAASVAADNANRLQQQAQAKAQQAASDLAELRANPAPPALAAKSHALIWIGVAVASGLGVMILMGGHSKRRAARRHKAANAITVIK